MVCTSADIIVSAVSSSHFSGQVCYMSDTKDQMAS
jgi:hypothetical protein